MTYDSNNIFAKILRGEIPCQKIHENDYGFAFYDINPKAPIHALVIPKNAYENFEDFYYKANPEEVLGFLACITKVTELLKINVSGYRLTSNCGEGGGQEVPHFHVHLLSGK